MADGETAVMQQPILPIRNPYLRGSWNLALWLVSHDQNTGIPHKSVGHCKFS